MYPYDFKDAVKKKVKNKNTCQLYPIIQEFQIKVT